MKGDPKCPCCALDLSGGVDRECGHFAKPFVRISKGRFYAMIDPNDGGPVLVKRDPYPSYELAAEAAANEAKRWTDAAWAMVRSGAPISKGGAA